MNNFSTHKHVEMRDWVAANMSSVFMNNFSTHKHVEMRDWVAANMSSVFNYSHSGSWLSSRSRCVLAS